MGEPNITHAKAFSMLQTEPKKHIPKTGKEAPTQYL